MIERLAVDTNALVGWLRSETGDPPPFGEARTIDRGFDAFSGLRVLHW